MTEREILIALNLAGEIGPRTVESLLSSIPSIPELGGLSAREIADRAGLSGGKVTAVVSALGSDEHRKEIEDARRGGAEIICRGEPGYPAPLEHMADPPVVLYVRGEYRPTDGVAIAVVGARRASSYGRQFTRKLSGGLAALGFTVVSGLARGIDAAAHRGAIEGGGRTIAVCGCGLSRIYPAEHEKLANEIAGAGALVSEFPMGFPVFPGNFPRRNRIISGLCLGVVVVEAARRSGSLITARHAFEQGREVFAVPGRAGSPTARGTHGLIKDGAKLVEDIDDILEEFPEVTRQLTSPEEKPAALERLSETEQKVFAACDDDPTDPETIAVAAGLEVREVLAALSTLSIKKLVSVGPGGLWTKRFGSR